MPSIAKINSIFEALKDSLPAGMTNKEMSETLNIPLSTCYRLLASLKKYEYVYQRKQDLRYFLGNAHLRYAQAIVEKSSGMDVIQEYLEKLHDKTKQTVIFVKLSGDYLVVLDVKGVTNTRIAVGIGEVLPMHCSAAGRAVLAYMDNEQKERVLSRDYGVMYTDKTINNRTMLEEHLHRIRKEKVSIVSEELNLGIKAMAVPIFGRNRQILGALSVVGAVNRLTDSVIENMKPVVLKYCFLIMSKMEGGIPLRFMKVVD